MANTDIVRLKNTVNEHDHVSGPESAPITIVEYGSFECIQCGRTYPVLKQVRKLLGDNLRFAYRHFPNVKSHPHSVRAAEAAESAGAQEKFWEMHDELFTHQAALEDHHLWQYARRIGLEAQRFERDMEENTFLKRIEGDYDRSIFDEHVTGTPTIYINGLRYNGAEDVGSLLEAVKEADTEGLIRLPETPGGIRGLIGRLRRGAHG